MDGFSTHLPILRAIGRCMPEIREVQEYGSGIYSTPLFLDRETYPNVTLVTSYETSEKWLYLAPKDARLIMLTGAIPEPRLTADLIFIDSDTQDNKIETIRLVRERYAGLVVIHDSENQHYWREIVQFKNYRNFNAFLPETAIASHRLLPVFNI